MNLRDKSDCGPFLNIYRSYLDDHAAGYYREVSMASVRSELRMFFKHLLRCKIDDIEDVHPHHLASFLKTLERTRATVRADYVKTMLSYLIKTKSYHGANPVLPRVMYKQATKGQPRPYDQGTLDFIWSLLDERGSALARFAVAFGEECGPRISEVSRIRECDIDRDERQIYIANPTKTGCEGYAPYGPKTEKWLEAWDRERPECASKYLLVTETGRQFNAGTLRDYLSDMLCKRSDQPRGLECFSYHRLRHTNATELSQGGLSIKENRKIHRWESSQSPSTYIAPPDWKEDRSEYDSAMG